MVHQLVKRYETDGAAAFAPRSRRPHTNSRAVSAEVEDRIVRLRKTLTKRGRDAGADTIAAHLAADPTVTKVPAVSTIWRILSCHGFITPLTATMPIAHDVPPSEGAGSAFCLRSQIVVLMLGPYTEAPLPMFATSGGVGPC